MIRVMQIQGACFEEVEVKQFSIEHLMEVLEYEAGRDTEVTYGEELVTVQIFDDEGDFIAFVGKRSEFSA